jgi:hypothetical protein
MSFDFSRISKYKTVVVSLLHTAFIYMIPVIFIVVAWLYFNGPEPLSLEAPKTLSFELKPEYLKKPVKIGYLLKTFSGELRKVIVYFDFYDHSNKFLSRLTYILSGSADYMNYVNQIISGTSYITVLRDYNKVGRKGIVVFKNILKDNNEGAKKISAPVLKRKDIASVMINLQAWYYAGEGKPGDVAVEFFCLDRYAKVRVR